MEPEEKGEWWTKEEGVIILPKHIVQDGAFQKKYTHMCTDIQTYM